MVADSSVLKRIGVFGTVHVHWRSEEGGRDVAIDITNPCFIKVIRIAVTMQMLELDLPKAVEEAVDAYVTKKTGVA